MHSQADSTFFAVPGEIRRAIYGFCFALDESDFTFSQIPKDTFLARVPFSQPLPGLMTTCKRAYREMEADKKQEAVLGAFRAGRIRRFGFAVHGTLRVERLQKLVCQVVMEDSHWGWWLRDFKDIMDRADELQELEIYWLLHKGQPYWKPGPRALPSKHFMAKLDQRTEDSFLDTIAARSGTGGKLQTVTLHGNVPGHWREQLGNMVGAKARVTLRKDAGSTNDGQHIADTVMSMLSLSLPVGHGFTWAWNEDLAFGRARESRLAVRSMTPLS